MEYLAGMEAVAFASEAAAELAEGLQQLGREFLTTGRGIYPVYTLGDASRAVSEQARYSDGVSLLCVMISSPTGLHR
jgi:hypothetical protein